MKRLIFNTPLVLLFQKSYQRQVRRWLLDSVHLLLCALSPLEREQSRSLAEQLTLSLEETKK